MTSVRNTLLAVSRAGMELSWRSAWAGFLTLAIIQRRLPLPEAMTAFAMAAILTRLPAGKNWRVYQTLLLQVSGFVVFAMLAVYRVEYPKLSFFSFDWVGDLFAKSKAPSHWFALLLLLFCLWLIWRGGQVWVKDAKEYLAVCTQFDKGLGLFFLLLLIKLLIQEKAGLRVEDPADGFPMIAFLIFSLAAIGLTRNTRDVQKTFLTGYHGVGIILGFSTVVVLFGSGLIFLFYPYLTRMADALRSVLGDVAEPMVPLLVRILAVLFVPGRIRNELSNSMAGPGSGGLSPPNFGGWEALLLKVIGFALLAIVGLMAIAAFYCLMMIVLRFLLRKNTQTGVHPISPSQFLKWFKALMLVPWYLWQACVHQLRRADSATSVYSGMLRWGRRSGLHPFLSETPAEYGKRLNQHFPRLRKEIEMIIEALHLEVYGEMVIDKGTLARIRSARRTMQSLRHWPSRARVWFSQ